MNAMWGIIDRLYAYMAGPSARAFLPGKVSYSYRDVYRRGDSTAMHAEGTLLLRSGVGIWFSLDIAGDTLTFCVANMADALVLKLGPEARSRYTRSLCGIEETAVVNRSSPECSWPVEA